MSAPDRESDDNASLNGGALNYPQKRAPPAGHDQNQESVAPRVDTTPRPDTREPPEPPWKRKKRRGAFAGDVAVAELRTRLALAPDRIAEPPAPDSTARVSGGVGRLIGVIALIAIGTVGYLWVQARRTTLPSQQFSPFSDRADSAPEPASAANLKASGLDSKPAAVRPAAGGLAPGTASDAVRGMPNGATSVTAAPTASARQFSEQDSRTSEPTQAVPPQPDANAAGIAFMMTNGSELMANGDIAGARLMFKRAAETGDAGAAFALAETYDPLVLRKLGTRIAMMSDIALAQSWYKKARELGSTQAQERIVRLTQLPE